MKFLVSVFTIFSLVSVAGIVKAQTILSPSELDNLLERAERSIINYSETFKNLSAEELKTFEDYDKNGEIKETRRIESTFIVYQSAKGGKVNEFRNVLEFNGKTVARQTEEIEKLFEKLARADSVADEWKKIRSEGMRFDGRSSAWGMTLWQESPFGNLKPFFEFAAVGRERIEGRDVFVVEYRQTKPTLLLKFNPTADDWKKEPRGREYHAEIGSNFRPFNARQNGKIWLDAETAQIWRNETKIFLEPAQISKPVLAVELIYEYQSSEFKILVPKKFVISFNRISGSNDKNLSVLRERKMTFDYSKFSEFRAETKDYKIAGR